jgi:hypothetical protein
VAALAPASGSDVTFLEPVAVSANANQAAAEPSIRAAQDGTLYIAAPTGLGGARVQEQGAGGDLIWRSDDGGKTWMYLGNYDPAAGGGDSDIAPDTGGILWGAGLTLVNTTVGISTDRGQTFKNNAVGTLDSVVDRQWIETYKSEPFAFLTTGQTTDMRIILSRLERVPGDYPVVSKTVTVSGDQEIYQWPGEIAVDERNDWVYVAYNTDGDPKDQDSIVVTRSDLALNATKRSVVAHTKGDTFDSFVGLDVDQAGNVYATWTERRPEGPKGRSGFTNSYVSYSTDQGKSWSDPVKVNVVMRTTAFPWLVAGSDGRVAVAYYGIRHRGPSPETVANQSRRLPKWKVWVSYSLQANKPNSHWTEVRAVKTPIHLGNICTSGTGCASGTRDLLDFFQVDIDPCGKLVITYTDNSEDVVGKNGERTQNNPEIVSFVKQAGGPRFYTEPSNPDIC